MRVVARARPNPERFCAWFLARRGLSARVTIASANRSSVSAITRMNSVDVRRWMVLSAEEHLDRVNPKDRFLNAFLLSAGVDQRR
jgi:hypothetical protein